MSRREVGCNNLAVREAEARDFWSAVGFQAFQIFPVTPFWMIGVGTFGGLYALLPNGIYVNQFLAMGILIATDMLLGTLRGIAFDRKGFSTLKFFRGLVKCAFVFAIPLGLYMAGHLDPSLEGIMKWLSSGAVVWFGLYEILSILKNAAQCGIPISPRLVKTLEGTLERSGEAPDKNSHDSQNHL